MKLSVLGAGAWGTALAVHASAGNDVLLWARSADQVAQMASSRRNERYLAGVVLPTALQIGADIDAAMDHAQGGMVIIATPMSGLDEMLQRLPAGIDASVLWLCKGFEQGTGWLGHEIGRASCRERV